MAEIITGENLKTRTSLGTINMMNHKEGLHFSFQLFIHCWKLWSVDERMLTGFRYLCRSGNRQNHHRQNAQGNFKFKKNENRGKGGGILYLSMHTLPRLLFSMNVV